jgi:hypothetical protein
MIAATKMTSNLNLQIQVLRTATEVTVTKIIVNFTFHLAICFQIYGQGMAESLKNKKATANIAGLFSYCC